MNYRLALLFLFAGCGRGAPGLVGVAPARDPIFYGSADPNDDAVVAIGFNDGQGEFCSGTLIAPTYVVTAGHCLEDLAGQTVYVFFGPDSMSPTDSRAVTRQAQHPSYNSTTLFADISMLELESPAPASAVPIPNLPGSLRITGADQGASLRFAGYGDTETGTYDTRLQFTGTLGYVCSGPSDCTYLGEDMVPRTIGYSMAAGGPCDGDSGGPAFIMRDSVAYVAAVTSYGDYSCVNDGVSTDVSAYESFIDQFMGVTAGCTDPSCMPGAPCTADDQCGPAGLCLTQASQPSFVGGYCTTSCQGAACPATSTCIDDEKGTNCRERCSTNQDCRDGYACTSFSGTQACWPQPATGACSGADCGSGGTTAGGATAPKSGKPSHGCDAVGASPLVALGLLAMVKRRRRAAA